MIARVRCSKCGELGKFDVGDVATVEAAQAKLDAAGIESCPFSNHIELSPITYTVLELVEGQAPSEEEWLAQMREDRDIWDTEALRQTEIRITGFALGFPMAEVRGSDFWLGMTTSPRGHRYFYAPKGAYAKAIGETEPQTTEA